MHAQLLKPLVPDLNVANSCGCDYSWELAKGWPCGSLWSDPLFRIWRLHSPVWKPILEPQTAYFLSNEGNELVRERISRYQHHETQRNLRNDHVLSKSRKTRRWGSKMRKQQIYYGGLVCYYRNYCTCSVLFRLWSIFCHPRTCQFYPSPTFQTLNGNCTLSHHPEWNVRRHSCNIFDFFLVFFAVPFCGRSKQDGITLLYLVPLPIACNREVWFSWVLPQTNITNNYYKLTAPKFANPKCSRLHRTTFHFASFLKCSDWAVKMVWWGLATRAGSGLNNDELDLASVSAKIKKTLRE